MINTDIRKIYDKIAMKEYGHKYSSHVLLPYEKEQVRKIALRMTNKHSAFGELNFNF